MDEILRYLRVDENKQSSVGLRKFTLIIQMSEHGASVSFRENDSVTMIVVELRRLVDLLIHLAGDKSRDELLPCPFCGGIPFTVPQDIGGGVIRCDKCSARVVSTCSMVDAKKNWNQRT